MPGLLEELATVRGLAIMGLPEQLLVSEEVEDLVRESLPNIICHRKHSPPVSCGSL